MNDEWWTQLTRNVIALLLRLDSQPLFFLMNSLSFLPIKGSVWSNHKSLSLSCVSCPSSVPIFVITTRWWRWSALCVSIDQSFSLLTFHTRQPCRPVTNLAKITQIQTHFIFVSLERIKEWNDALSNATLNFESWIDIQIQIESFYWSTEREREREREKQNELKNVLLNFDKNW